MRVDFEAIKTNFAETMLLNADVLEINCHENLLRVLLKDNADLSLLPYSFVDDSGYEIGICYQTVSQVDAHNTNLELIKEALASNNDPTKTDQQKVAEFFAARAAAPAVVDE
jgi:hypothetical protein